MHTTGTPRRFTAGPNAYPCPRPAASRPTHEAEEEARQQLARVARERDPDALAALYATFSGPVFAVTLQLLRDRMLAEEVVQGAFLNVWRHSDRYDRARGSVGNWILTIAHNQAIDRLRRQSRRLPERALAPAHERLLHCPDAWHEVDRLLDQQRVMAALDTLPEAQRTAVVLAYYAGCSHSDIALLQRVPLGTVKGRLRLAMDKLRFALATPDVSTDAHP